MRRKPERARYDSAAVHEVLDAAPFCHVATVRHGRPVVLPMVHARLGDTLVLHGSLAAGLFRDMRGSQPGLRDRDHARRAGAGPVGPQPLGELPVGHRARPRH